MMRRVAVLGSTGSIGTTALKVLARHRDRRRQRRAGMGEVDDDAERLARLDELAASRRPDFGLDRRRGGLERHPPRREQGERAQPAEKELNARGI